MTIDPKLMDPERLALIEQEESLLMPVSMATGWSVAARRTEVLTVAQLIRELRGHAKHWEAEAGRLALELGPLLEGATNIGNIDGIETGSPSVDALVNAGASLMITALRAHPKAENGLRVDVQVNTPDGERPASVFAQWGHGSVKDVVGHIMRASALEERLAGADQINRVLREELEDRDAEIKRYRDRCPLFAEDAARSGVTWSQCMAMAAQQEHADAFVSGLLGRDCTTADLFDSEVHVESMAIVCTIKWLAAVTHRNAWDILDEMAAMDPS